MSKKILIYFAALVMTESYYSVTIASDSSGSGSFEDHTLSVSPEDKNNGFCNMKSMKYVEHSNTESKILDDCKSNNNNIVDYDEETMWFDYQTLFDKTKNIMLGKNDTTEVKHVDFKKDSFAKKVVFGTSMYDDCDEYYESNLYDIENGDVYAQSDAMYNMLDYCKSNEFINENSFDYLNYKYMLGIVSSFLSSDQDIKYLLHQESSCFPDDYINYNNIKNIDYKTVMNYLLQK